MSDMCPVCGKTSHGQFDRYTTPNIFLCNECAAKARGLNFANADDEITHLRAELAAKDERIKDLEAVCLWYIARMPQGHPVRGIDDLIERVRDEEALR